MCSNSQGHYGDRQTGRTTKQINEAPEGALFVVPNWQAINYTRHLAQRLGRKDLRFTVPEYVYIDVVGTGRAVVVDHAARLTLDEQDAVTEANHRRKHEN
jgi:hypothetical protein